MAQHIVSGAAGVIGGDTNIDVTEALAAMQEGLKDMEIPELLLLVMEEGAWATRVSFVYSAKEQTVYYVENNHFECIQTFTFPLEQ